MKLELEIEKGIETYSSMRIQNLLQFIQISYLIYSPPKGVY